MPLNEDKFTYFCLHLNVLLHKMFTIRSNNKEHKIEEKSDPYEKKQPMEAYPKMVQIIELFDRLLNNYDKNAKECSKACGQYA